MRRTFSILFGLALVLSLSLVTATQTTMPVMAASMYEHYNTGDDWHSAIGGSTWRAQTFTPSVAHTITSVKLMLYRSGSPGTVTVSIRATSGGLPTGSDLCSGTTNGDTLTTLASGEWREITLGSGYSLSAGTQYAIVVRAPAATAGNLLFWRLDRTSPGYTGGESTGSSDSGSSWSPISIADYMFEEWGNVTVGWETHPINKVRVLLPWIALFAAIMAGASLLVLRRRRVHS